MSALSELSQIPILIDYEKNSKVKRIKNTSLIGKKHMYEVEISSTGTITPLNASKLLSHSYLLMLAQVSSIWLFILPKVN